MLQKAEILITGYENGIGIQWSAPTDEYEIVREVAKNEEIESVIGRHLWEDVNEIFSKMGPLAVKIKLEYEIINF